VVACVAWWALWTRIKRVKTSLFDLYKSALAFELAHDGPMRAHDALLWSWRQRVCWTGWLSFVSNFTDRWR